MGLRNIAFLPITLDGVTDPQEFFFSINLYTYICRKQVLIGKCWTSFYILPSNTATKLGSHPASGGYKYRVLVLRDGDWAWG
jgi:hypothetical protein